MFSVIFRSAATSALCMLGLWLLVTVVWQWVVGMVIDALAPNELARLLGVQSIEQMQWQMALSRLSPNVLFIESILALPQPTTRSLGLGFPTDLIGAVP